MSRSSNGFALLEALVALAIVGTFVVAVLTTLGAQVRAADQASTLLIAQSLAEDRATMLELLDYDDLTSLPDSLVAGSFPPPFAAYSWAAAVTPVEDEYDLFATHVLVSNGAFAFRLDGMIHRSGATVLAVDGE